MLGVPGLAHGLYVKSLALTGMEIRVRIHHKDGLKTVQNLRSIRSWTFIESHKIAELFDIKAP